MPLTQERQVVASEHVAQGETQGEHVPLMITAVEAGQAGTQDPFDK